MDRLLLTTSEAADALGVSRDTVCRLIRSGALPGVNIATGKRNALRVRPADLRAYVDAHVVPVGADDGGSS